MSAIEQCRTAVPGGHVLRCGACEQVKIAYNSCRNRDCPKCQATAARRWLEACQADLLPVEFYHVVFTLPAPISAIAYANKAVMYGLLFDIAADTLRTIAADPRHLGAQIGATLVLHTWGSALTHHPHVHGIGPGGGLSPDGERWIACRRGFFLPMSVQESKQLQITAIIIESNRSAVIGHSVWLVKATNKIYETDWVHAAEYSEDGRIRRFQLVFDTAATSAAFTPN
jgi:hypothetical protein